MKFPIFHVLMLIPSLLFGRIIETESFQDILIHLDQALPSSKKAMVICDLDNTLMMSCEHLGSVAWGEYLKNKLQARGVSKEEAGIIEHIIWKAIQPHIQVRTIDPKTSEVIGELKNRHIPILGLTARYPDESWYTLNQLKSVDIDFSQQKYLPETKLDIPLKSYAAYENGILFSTTINKKSAVLVKFLELYNMEINYMIFVDDKLHHIKDVEEACQRLGIECLGIRFSGADEHVKEFDPVQAELQWEAFPNRLSL